SDKAPIYEDFDAYFATFDEGERQELAHADAALDLSILLHRARAARGLTQIAAAARSGVKQQAISRWEHSHPNMKLDSLQKYLEALGYTLELVIKDAETGAILTPEVFAPATGDELSGDPQAPEAPAPDHLLSRSAGQS
ncbi:MAG TPA: helix-turn-helix transcriptional regulator, partial [Ktedonobacterales bacterium]|nr:helix-turn-helix transcriptional regulator [Ktedonobacterales bacterium]